MSRRICKSTILSSWSGGSKRYSTKWLLTNSEKVRLVSVGGGVWGASTAAGGGDGERGISMKEGLSVRVKVELARNVVKRLAYLDEGEE